MISINILYPSGEGKTFDMDYYIKSHISMVHELLDDEGMTSVEVDKGLASMQEGEPAPFLCIAKLHFTSIEKFQAALGKHGDALMADIPNFTNTQPQIQVSEAVAS